MVLQEGGGDARTRLRTYIVMPGLRTVMALLIVHYSTCSVFALDGFLVIGDTLVQYSEC
jgi:hypothetical protein